MTTYEHPSHHAGKREFLYGAYKVQLEDGFTMLSPHIAMEATISVEPVDLDLNPEFAEVLVREAKRAREGYHGAPVEPTEAPMGQGVSDDRQDTDETDDVTKAC
jgi:hypothetical protein